uniref:Uncharacterized protein n=1 Tax=Rhodosorus marinus TaxID=101924 RepID=A0A7S3EEW2_9RHOD|mmetsp:Transcript_309/g.712  ORF Transcript_309/g.712 Transcript_309/m.712 type:complete len:117 (+) Transcript_309:490-840(+)
MASPETGSRGERLDYSSCVRQTQKQVNHDAGHAGLETNKLPRLQLLPHLRNFSSPSVTLPNLSSLLYVGRMENSGTDTPLRVHRYASAYGQEFELKGLNPISEHNDFACPDTGLGR